LPKPHEPTRSPKLCQRACKVTSGKIVLKNLDIDVDVFYAISFSSSRVVLQGHFNSTLCQELVKYESLVNDAGFLNFKIGNHIEICLT
jgi:hypothetical protein